MPKKSSAINVIVNADKFLESTLLKFKHSLETRMIEFFQRHYPARGAEVEWIWQLQVEVGESEVKEEVSRLLDALAFLVHAKFNAAKNYMLFALRVDAANQQQIKAGDRTVTIDPLRPFTLEEKRRLGVQREFLTKTGLLRSQLSAPINFTVNKSRSGFVVSWDVGDIPERLLQFHEGVPKNNQVPRPALDIVVGHLESLINQAIQSLEVREYDGISDYTRAVRNLA